MLNAVSADVCVCAFMFIDTSRVGETLIIYIYGRHTIMQFLFTQIILVSNKDNFNRSIYINPMDCGFYNYLSTFSNHMLNKAWPWFIPQCGYGMWLTKSKSWIRWTTDFFLAMNWIDYYFIGKKKGQDFIFY